MAVSKPLPLPLPAPNLAHPLSGRLYPRSAAKAIILRRFLAVKPRDIEDFIRQTFGVRWAGDHDRDAVIAGWLAELVDIPPALLPY